MAGGNGWKRGANHAKKKTSTAQQGGKGDRGFLECFHRAEPRTSFKQSSMDVLLDFDPTTSGIDISSFASNINMVEINEVNDASAAAAAEAKKKRDKQAARACVLCNQAHTACDNGMWILHSCVRP